MKLIIAYIQPEQLNEVKQALYEKEVYKMSVTNAMGCGQQKGYHETYRGADIEVNLLKKVRMEIAVNAEFVDSTIIRIRTGEKGPEAVG
jgi:nitrogen regulatory protein P-II 1